MYLYFHYDYSESCSKQNIRDPEKVERSTRTV